MYIYSFCMELMKSLCSVVNAMANNASSPSSGSTPTNPSELQLYRVLQKANLIQYYDTFISQGGDDVKQLVEAGEEEFLEIMALVGMASKPLHVRRLQKSLQEWVANPASFQQPVQSSPGGPTVSSILAASLQQPISVPTYQPNSSSKPRTTSPQSSQQHGTISAHTWTPGLNAGSPSAASTASDHSATSPVQGNNPYLLQTLTSQSVSSDAHDRDMNSGSPVPNAQLSSYQIDSIAQVAEVFCKTLPPVEQKPMNMKKDISREIQNVIDMSFDAPSRMDAIYKYSAIYGRFDSSRKKDKPMSLHEVSVNEAAAQICKWHPALLTRRDELFPLARQVVKLSGYQYSKGHSRMSDHVDKKHLTDVEMLSNSKIIQKTEEQLIEVNHELNEIIPKIEELKTKMNDSEDDADFTESIQTELNDLSARYKQLTSEQTTLINRQKRAQLHLQNRSVESSENGTASPSQSGSSSPRSTHGDDMYPTPAKRNPAKTKDYIQKSLFDEGLRIAQQYGMGDFAAELNDLKPEDGGVNPDEICSSESKDRMTTNNNVSNIGCSGAGAGAGGEEGVILRRELENRNGKMITDDIRLPDESV
ncbi:NGFI-A-binding protein 1-like isoform X2 [Tubulanus polymorphus]|uniref:NGFI-A-binding protein 1-like isoform X2 n=1 Tax=Tubulanus polymorphus TaxID=672921 RepID=UPI003DA6757A